MIPSTLPRKERDFPSGVEREQTISMDMMDG